MSPTLSKSKPKLGKSKSRKPINISFVMILSSQDHIQNFSFSMRIPHQVDHDPYLLDMFCCSNTDKCSVSPHPLLGTSNHLVISIDIKSTNEHPYCNVYSYKKRDWDSFH